MAFVLRGMETGDMLDRLGSDLLDVLVEYCDWRSSLALSASSATLRASTTTVDPLGPLLRVAHTNSRALCYSVSYTHLTLPTKA